jgi:hypothetical protein
MENNHADHKIRIHIYERQSGDSFIPMPARCEFLSGQNPYSDNQEVFRNSEFVLLSNNASFSHKTFHGVDVLVLIYPSNPGSGSVNSKHSTRLETAEIESIRSFVATGGNLLVIAAWGNEVTWEHLSILMVKFNISLEKESLISDHAAIISKCEIGRGRMLLVSDKEVIGREYVEGVLRDSRWSKHFYWLSKNTASARFNNNNIEADRISEYIAWKKAKSVIGALQDMEDQKAAIIPAKKTDAKSLINELIPAVVDLGGAFPHQTDYFTSLIADFEKWIAEDFGEPDFSNSLQTIHLEKHREDGKYSVAIFPMYTPNNSLDYKFEALLFKSVYPAWLQTINDGKVKNELFIAGALIDYTRGYASECAVFFPEMVKVRRRINNDFGVLFVSREAARCQRITKMALAYLKVTCPAEVEFYLNCSDIIQDAFALWDLLHDKSHMEGFLPFDPFMVRQRSPFWMYSLEELRADLESYQKALSLENEGFNYAKWVKYSIIFDRVFRFPLALSHRIKDYDGVAGQILSNYLFSNNIFKFKDRRMVIEWSDLDSAVLKLRALISDLYWRGLQTNKMKHWQNGHDLISNYLDPHYNSKWQKDHRQNNNFSSESDWLNAVEDDEFPHNQFYMYLKRGTRPIHANS